MFDQRGELCSKLKKYLARTCDIIPTIENTNNWYFDWNIIGSDFEKWFGYNQPIKPETLDFETWESNIVPIREWINWVSKNIFYPTKIVKTTQLTDKVNIRIAVSKLNKLVIPRKYTDNMFDNMLFTYHCRKRGYESYYWEVIQGLPF